jgi:hypothetical protein
MAKFEVGIYNEEVRARQREGLRHKDLSSDWADIHYYDVEADNVEGARSKIMRKYPAERGYVIESIDPKY